jgi:hypothetical protein
MEKKLGIEDFTPELVTYIHTLTNRCQEISYPETERYVKERLGFGPWNMTAEAEAFLNTKIFDQWTVARDRYLAHINKMFNPKPTKKEKEDEQR